MLTLPPYSPELNPVEKWWDIVRDGICHRVFATLEELQVALTAVLQSYWQDAHGFFLDRERLAAARSKRFWFKRCTGVS